jgi:pimeloyl-ACP methyl ester carboxylesterase
LLCCVRNWLEASVQKHPAAKREELMTTTERPIEECVVELLGHLGIERAHIAAGGAPTLTDWHGLAARHPERIASLTVVSPPIIDGSELAAIASRLLVVAGDQADTDQGAVRLASDLPGVSLHSLHGYEAQPWADVVADRGDELAAAMARSNSPGSLIGPPCASADGR